MRLNRKGCEAEKLRLIKNLLNERHTLTTKRKVVPFSVNHKPKAFQQLKAEYIHLLTTFEHDEHSTTQKQKIDFTNNPELLVGNRIQQKFMEDREAQWYEGYVISFDTDSRLHEVVYNGESEFYNLLEDLKDNSLLVHCIMTSIMNNN